MRKTLMSLFLLAIFSFTTFAQADKIVGHWKTIDDDGKTVKSIVNIYKATNGKYYGKIEKLFQNPDKICADCEGALKDKPVLGMVIIYNMHEKEGTLTGGTILDPANGKVYYCTLTLDERTGKLNVRGSLDKRGWLGRSQVWLRLTD
jgi:uncharacterized protein (DUF2147 family)